MEKNVRVRFAPSPTGGLHLGGVRTALFNYLFAKKNGGKFILRIEDTDQTRFVPGAEKYILDCLAWCGLTPDESPENPGNYGPYRQSERKASYKQYAEQLIQSGHAYYAFDTAEELEQKRKEQPNFQYGQATRMQMRNSLSLAPSEVEALLAAGTPHVVRILIPENETVRFTDIIRGEVSFDTNLVDDKVLLKADEMPTYHLAVVVDDKAMDISHAFRGEEWLPSAPIHILLWKYLGWEDEMPEWAHLPLILKPDGNGKLSKRDGDRLGFPVYAQNWVDPKTGDLTKGFKELGFLPEAFVNLLAMLGWNDGSDQEIFTLAELAEVFSLSRVSKAGAKFDYEKAKWFNQAWIKRIEAASLWEILKTDLSTPETTVEYGIQVIELIKDRCTLLSDFKIQGAYFFEAPKELDLDAVKPKWNADKSIFFEAYANSLANATNLNSNTVHEVAQMENEFKDLAIQHALKPGEVMLPLRIFLVGGKFGPGVFDIIKLLGITEAKSRISHALAQLA
ncbi:MAG: glutamate--tRNA ligase [Pedobacter sp.]|nr:MAG: glutamate--tRNA ligase [Pedobacter sp.]